MKLFHPMLLLAATLLAVGLACTASGGGGTSSPTVTVTQQATLAATMPAVTEFPTPLPTPTKIRAFFTEEFDEGYPVNHWQSFNLGRGQMGNLAVQQQDDHLLFDLTDEDLYIYYMFTPYTYTNVSISLQAENLGSNNNNVSLVCRMNSDASKWYEFSVTSSGLWNLFAMDNGMYHIIGGGGTNFLKLGQEANEYQMICNGNQITLLINGSEVKTITDDKYGFNEGFVGFNVSSLKGYSVLPITVAVDSFAIDLP